MQFKIHDCVSITREHKNRDQSWRDDHYQGIIIEITANKIKFINSAGEEREVALYENEEYAATNIVPFSEVIFSQNIRKAIEEQEKAIERETVRYNEITAWREKFESDISLLGKLKRFLKVETGWD